MTSFLNFLHPEGSWGTNTLPMSPAPDLTPTSFLMFAVRSECERTGRVLAGEGTATSRGLSRVTLPSATRMPLFLLVPRVTPEPIGGLTKLGRNTSENKGLKINPENTNGFCLPKASFACIRRGIPEPGQITDAHPVSTNNGCLILCCFKGRYSNVCGFGSRSAHVH